jgi:hypothetical protein
MTTRWIEIDRAVSFTHLATTLMESIWTIARARYLGELPDAINSWLKPDYQDVANRLEGGKTSGVFVDTMHMELLYYASVPARQS